MESIERNHEIEEFAAELFDYIANIDLWVPYGHKRAKAEFAKKMRDLNMPGFDPTAWEETWEEYDED